MTPRRTHRSRPIAAALAGVLAMFAVGASGCDDDMESPSTLVDPQILAVQLTPRNLQPGETHTAVVLGHGIEDAALTWQSCILPWLPEEAGLRCAAEDITPEAIAQITGLTDDTQLADMVDMVNQAIPLNPDDTTLGHTLSFPTFAPPTNPCETTADCSGFGDCINQTCTLGLWLRVDDPRDNGALTTLAHLTPGEVLDNPSVTDLYKDQAGTALPSELQAGAEVVILPALVDPMGEGGTVVSYYTTGGRFDPWRNRQEAPVTLTAPDEPGEITLTAIVRDPGGGVGWLQRTLTITEAP